MAFPSIIPFPPHHKCAALLASLRRWWAGATRCLCCWRLPRLPLRVPEGLQVSVILLHIILKKNQTPPPTPQITGKTLWRKPVPLCWQPAAEVAGASAAHQPCGGGRSPSHAAWAASPAPAGEGWKMPPTQHCCPLHGSAMNRECRTPSDALKHVFSVHAGSMFSYGTNRSPATAEQSDGHRGGG